MALKDLLGQGSVTIETLFDEFAPVFSKDAFQEPIIADLQAKGKYVMEIGESDGNSDLVLKVIDPYEAAGYNTFRSVKEYENWASGNLPFPTKEDIEEKLNGPRS